MKKLLAVIAAVGVFGGTVVLAQADDEPVDFQLNCTRTGRQIECSGMLPEEEGPSSTAEITVAPTTTLQATTTAPPLETTTTQAASTTSTTSSSVATTTTSSPASSSTTSPASTTSAPSTTQPSASSTTSSTTTTSTTTTLPPGPTTTQPAGQGFAASFATPSDFYGRFWTYVGNACNSSGTCEPCAAGVGICEFPGDHDMNCGAPTTSRTVHVINKPELFWHCAPGGDPAAGHVMIGLNTSGYAISGFTPRQSFSNIRSVCWDQNLTDLGGGKWMVLTIIPASQMVPQSAQPTSPYRLDYTLPEFDADNAPGDFNVQRAQRLQFKLFRNQLRLFNRLGSFSTGGASDWGSDGGSIAGADKATRYRHCLTENASGNIVVTQAGQTWTTTVRFPDVPSYVIWADDTYDADKHGGTGRYTWHFDNIAIS